MTANFFELLGLPLRHSIDGDDLERRHRGLLERLHPDRHVSSSAGQRRIAEQYAADVNEAYRVLADPLSRAAHLLALRGRDPFAEEAGGGGLPTEFLARQLELHEHLDEIEAAGDHAAAAALASELEAEIDGEMGALASLLDDRPDQVETAVEAALRLRYLRNSLAKAARLAKQG